MPGKGNARKPFPIHILEHPSPGSEAELLNCCVSWAVHRKWHWSLVEFFVTSSAWAEPQLVLQGSKVTSDTLKAGLHSHSRVFSLLFHIYISLSQTKGSAGWEFSDKSSHDGRGRSQRKVPVGREVLCLPQQKLYLPLQDLPPSHRVKNLHLPGPSSGYLLWAGIFPVLI